MAVDVDRDGYPDIVAISEGPTGSRETAVGKMRVFYNRGKGAEWIGQDIADVGKVLGADWMAVGHFNKDKYPDFVGGSIYYQASQIIYLSQNKLKWEPVTSDGTVVPFLSYYFAVAAGHFRSATSLDDAILSYARFWPEVETSIVPAPPQPLRTPLLDQFPEKMSTTFCPRLAICASTCDFAPVPIPTMAMTALTPMMMPRAVSVERSLLRRNARSANRSVAAILMTKV